MKILKKQQSNNRPAIRFGEVDENSKLIFFKFRSAIIFFACALILNALVHPLFLKLGLEKTLSLFLVNVVGLSGVLAIIIVHIEKKFTEKKQKIALFFVILFIFSLVGFFIL